MRRVQTAARMFAMPALIAVVSLAGLIAGLLGDGLPDVVANVALALPVAIIAWMLHRARRLPV